MKLRITRLAPLVLDESRAAPIVKAAVEAGVTFFDTPTCTRGRERGRHGRLLRSSVDATKLVIATQGLQPDDDGPNGQGLSRKHIHVGDRRVATRLGLDYVDSTRSTRFDPATPVEETIGGAARHRPRGQGALSARAACSRGSREAAARSRQHGLTRFVSMQEPLQPALPRGGAGDDPALHDQGVGNRAVSPLARAPGWPARGRAPARRRACAPDRRVPDALYGRSEDFDVIRRGARGSRLPVECRPHKVALGWLL